MIRFSLAIACICVLFLACAGSPDPQVTNNSGVERYSGSADDSGTVNRAAAPSGIKRIKSEELRVLVAQYEADMDEYLAAGNYPAAIEAFNKAADAYSSNTSNQDISAGIRLKMKQALDAVQITKVSVPGDTVSGRPFPRAFSIKAVADRESGSLPLAGLPCTVTYPAYREDGTRYTESVEIVTNESGLASFTAPVPGYTGRNTLIVSINVALRDEILAAELRRETGGAFSVSFVHGVETNRKNIPTTLSFLDYDKNGNPVLHNNQTATRLLRPLIQRGFSRIGMADFPRQLAAGDEEKLIAAARAQFGSGVQRFIYGTTRVTSLSRNDDGKWVCTIEGSISVWDFTTNSKTYSTNLTHSAEGASEAAALETARNELSGSIMVDDLRYNL